MLTLTLMIASRTADLLPHRVRNSAFTRADYFIEHKEVREPSTLFDVLGSIGIPSCEVGPVTDRESGEDFDPHRLVRGGENLRVDDPPPIPLETPRFLCDLHLGKLVLLLRVLGFDTLWENSGDEAVMADRAVAKGRWALSRNLALLKRRVMRRALLIRSDNPDQQAVEVLRRFMLAGRVRLFGRCSRCNGTLAPVAKSEVADRIPPKTAAWLDDYYVCGDCDQLFWEGTHVTALRERVARILSDRDYEDP